MKHYCAILRLTCHRDTGALSGLPPRVTLVKHGRSVAEALASFKADGLVHALAEPASQDLSDLEHWIHNAVGEADVAEPFDPCVEVKTVCNLYPRGLWVVELLVQDVSRLLGDAPGGEEANPHDA